MTASVLALRAGLFSRLAADSALTVLIGANRIFDAAPRAQAFPYLVLASLGSRPLLSRIEEGEEHDLVLAAFSRAPGRDQALSAVLRAVSVLVEDPPALDGHRLIGLQGADVSSRLLRDGRTFRAEATLRAVTEPAG